MPFNAIRILKLFQKIVIYSKLKHVIALNAESWYKYKHGGVMNREAVQID